MWNLTAEGYLDLPGLWEDCGGNAGLGDDVLPSHLLSAAMGYCQQWPEEGPSQSHRKLGFHL